MGLSKYLSSFYRLQLVYTCTIVMAVNSYFFTCQVTACNKKFRSLRALVGHMNLQHAGNKLLGLYCDIYDCNFMYNTVTAFRCRITRRHGNYLESLSIVAAGTPPTGDTNGYWCQHCHVSWRKISSQPSQWYSSALQQHIALCVCSMKTCYSTLCEFLLLNGHSTQN